MGPWRASIFWGRVLVLLAGLLLPTGAAYGVAGSYLGQQGFNEQVQNAADAAESALAAAATNGNTVRGASGTLGTLLLNSKELICSSWIIKFKTDIRNMHIAAAGMDGEAADRQANAIAKAEAFVNKLVKACDETFGLAPPPPGGGGGGGSTGGGAGGSAGGSNSGSGSGGSNDSGSTASPRLPGESTADYICRKRCAALYDAMLGALAAMDRANQAADQAAQAAAAAHAAADQARADLQNAQQQLAAQEARLSDLKSNPPPPMTSGRDAAQLQAWSDYSSARNSTQASIKALKDKIDRLQQDIKDKENDAKDKDKAAQKAKSDAEQAQADAQAAVDAYNACLKKCRDEAAMGGENVTIPPAPPPPKHHNSLLDNLHIGVGIGVGGGGGQRDDRDLHNHNGPRDQNGSPSQSESPGQTPGQTQNPGPSSKPQQ
jgi:hypothetical protein